MPIGCVTHVLKSNLKELSVFDLCDVEILQQTTLLGSSFVLHRYLPLDFIYIPCRFVPEVFCTSICYCNFIH